MLVILLTILAAGCGQPAKSDGPPPVTGAVELRQLSDLRALIVQFTSLKYDEFSRVYREATFDFTGTVQPGESEAALKTLRASSTVFVALPRHEKNDYFLDEKTNTMKPYPEQLILCDFDNTLKQGLYNGPSSLKPGDRIRVRGKLKTKSQSAGRYPFVDASLRYLTVDTLTIEQL